MSGMGARAPYRPVDGAKAVNCRSIGVVNRSEPAVGPTSVDGAKAVNHRSIGVVNYRSEPKP
jgi:hypothetical protein